MGIGFFVYFFLLFYRLLETRLFVNLEKGEGLNLEVGGGVGGGKECW